MYYKNYVIKFLLTFIATLLLSGCADSFSSYFKRSANNKLIDSKGFKGGKRRPLYNKKYISLAKKNIIEDNLDEDEEDEDDNPETISPSDVNRQMYIKMLKRDQQKRKQMQMAKQKANKSLVDANQKSGNVSNPSAHDLQQELSEIKSLLNEAKQDMAKYKCPTPNHRQ